MTEVWQSGSILAARTTSNTNDQLIAKCRRVTVLSPDDEAHQQAAFGGVLALGHHRLQGKQRGAAEQQALHVVRHTALRV